MKTVEPIASDCFVQLTDEYLDKNGFVNYDALMSPPGLELLGKNKYHVANSNASNLGSKSAQLAFYCNAYNMLCLILMTERLLKDPTYSNDSLLNRGKFFKWDSHVVCGKTMTLGLLENDIIRSYGDPRIHFFINCASKSCPILRKDLLTEDNVDQILEESTRSFVNEQGGAQYDPGTNTLAVSKIFDWYVSDFKSAGGVVKFVKRYHVDGERIGDNVKLTTVEYEWCVNGKVTKKK
eukprot:comp38420_c0_seq1/m.47353 comp38420_c0_seq1/g.47353  ORF comp38420_c0_seq1/g.47353 comp38420_c0_seq1/m.47353 type:complete len:237 (-) comp38420_c0_seq1:61-771(-)